MGKYTFRIDNKDPLYKKLIKLPTTYYRLKKNGNVYTIDSHIGTVENISDLELQKQGDKIVLYKGNSPLKLKKQNDNGLIIEEDFVIEREAITGEDRNNIIRALESGEVIKTSLKDITDSPYFGIELYISRHDPARGVLKFINFYDENDPVLQKIKKDTGGLYFTIKDNDVDCSRTVYISDKNGRPLSAYNDYQYQYKSNVAELETIDSIQAENAKQNFTLQKEEKLSDDVYEANIVLNDKPIATLPKIGYYMSNDQLIIRNHVTKEKVVIPSDFHFLKVVKFNNGDYKLTFCNVLGNEFFEHKKYDPQYSNVSDEYKFISLNCAEKEYNPNLSELFSHRPSFFITEGPAEPDSPGHYQADVFELKNSGKDRKMATLIDKFCYFNENDQFKCCNYHKGMEGRIYNTSEINQEYRITDANSEFFLAGQDDIILHTIPELT